MSKECKHCHAINPEEALYCGKCGEPLDGEKHALEENIKKMQDQLDKIEPRATPRPTITRPTIPEPSYTSVPQQTNTTQVPTARTYEPRRPAATPTSTNQHHPTEPTRPWYQQWYVWACTATVACLAVFFICSPQHETQEVDAATQKEASVMTAISKLEGNYTLRERNGSTAINGIRTAAVKKLSDSQAQILVVSEYEPELYRFTYNTNGTVTSEQLGNGEITYNDQLEIITITFKQGERICEFIK